MTDRLQSLADVLAVTEDKLRAGVSAGARVWPTGFGVLDHHLAGGLRSGELTLLGGAPGLGKTTFALQVLRHAARSGSTVVYFSFEHDTHTLLQRLLAIEAAEVDGAPARPLRRLAEVFEARHNAATSLEEMLTEMVGGREAVRALRGYAERLNLHGSSGTSTTVETIRDVVRQVEERSGHQPLVVVDYLQKVAAPGQPVWEDERVTTIVEGLKDLALDAGVPVLAIVAGDQDSLAGGRRMRVQHLRGSTALAHEADVIMILNEKYDVVARHHLVFDLGNAERFRGWAVVSIEKNRNGVDHVDLEFRKRFEAGRFDPDGGLVAEQLVDERVFVD
ncbi:MAG: DnaB-like helicase C-terminal domain-containing protein [Nocardioidaceae bacterium]